MKPRFSARPLFAAIGAVACLLTALALEPAIKAARVSRWPDINTTPVLLFLFPHRSDTEQRLHQANAKTGDVEISLTWNNTNDLDLHCIDSAGEHIFYGHTLSERTGGNLDIDQNAAVPYTQRPVEHIYWPRGRAPRGRYRVYVNEFKQHGGSDPTPYQVIVKEYGHSHTYTGTVSASIVHRPDEPGKFICEFNPGQAGFSIAGLSAGFWLALALVAAWTAIVACLLAAALLLGLHIFYRRVYKRHFLPFKKAVGIAAGSLAWGLAAGAFGQALYSLLPDILLKTHPTLSHLAGLMLLGAILGAGLGGRVPHLPNFLSVVVAALVAAPASFAFVKLTEFVPQIWGRAAVAALFGLFIGLLIALIVEPPEPPIEVEDDVLEGMRPLALRANHIGPAGKLRRAGKEPAAR